MSFAVDASPVPQFPAITVFDDVTARQCNSRHEFLLTASTSGGHHSLSLPDSLRHKSSSVREKRGLESRHREQIGD